MLPPARSPRRRAGPLAGAAAALLLLSAPARAQEAPPTIYKWVDENGIAHYTADRDRIPRNLRNRIRDTRGNPVAIPPAAEGAATASPAPRPGPGAPPDETWAVRDAGPVQAEQVARPPLQDPLEPRAAGAPPAQGSGEEPRAVQAAPTPGSGEEPAASTPAVSAAAPPAPAQPASGSDAADLDRRIAELEAAVQADETALKQIISETPQGTDKTPLYDREDFRELAHRFPKLQAELAALREERSRLARP